MNGDICDLTLSKEIYKPAVGALLPGVGHTLHCDLRGSCDHASVPGRDDDGRGNGICWTANV